MGYWVFSWWRQRYLVGIFRSKSSTGGGEGDGGVAGHRRKKKEAAIWVLFAAEESVKEAAVEVRRKGWRGVSVLTRLELRRREKKERRGCGSLGGTWWLVDGERGGFGFWLGEGGTGGCCGWLEKKWRGSGSEVAGGIVRERRWRGRKE
ncbi:hypothetical protein HAX54_047588, partial [Datura stramonium]|nr:hypothetical protein [Datura stramonium]